MKVVLAGAGAFGKKHLGGIRNIDGVECVSIVGRKRAATEAVAETYGIPHVCTDLAEALEQPDVDAAALPGELQGREWLHRFKTAHIGRGRVHGDVDFRQGRRRRFVIGFEGRRGLVCKGGRWAGGRDGRRVLSVSITIPHRWRGGRMLSTLG